MVDLGGLFWDILRPGAELGPTDHRGYRPAGWIEAGMEKIDQMRPIAEKHGLTMIQLACLWNLAQPAYPYWPLAPRVFPQHAPG